MGDPRGRCRSCDAPILWAVTEADPGKKRKSQKIPLDADPTCPGKALLVFEGNLEFTRERDGDGNWIVRYVKAGAGAHVSHFATCPNAREHRRPKGKVRG